MNDTTRDGPARFGSVLGIAPGNVPAYSSDYETADDRELPDRHAYRSVVDGIYMGYKWQCVEFARRWLYLNHGYVFDDIPMAYDIFRLRHVRAPGGDHALPLYSFRNGSKRHPEPGCLLIWDEGGEFETTGHVAVVTEVAPGYVRVAEQNVGNRPWPAGRDYSREIRARVGEHGDYWLECTFGNACILGWVLRTDDATHAEDVSDPDPALFRVQERLLHPAAEPSSEWLNLANDDEAAYVDMMGGHLLSANPADRYRYFAVSRTAQAELRRATNELHALFMHATDYVLRDDSRLERFNIPRCLWPKIHQSWDNRRNELITARFDFAVTEAGVKVYEYNCDSASCHMETGKVQGKWAEHYGCHDGDDAGRQLSEKLLAAWRHGEVDGLLHIMQDRDLEETYHALYMRDIIEKAGIRTKIIRGISGLSWGPDGSILDREGVPIRWVWKTWAWESALDQIREECEDDEEKLQNYEPGEVHDGPPRLVDVLLRREVMVFEPLWTLIPSNKAILPVLWTLFPNHPYLLNSSYELSDELLARGYVVKPIVGRGGSNISMVDRNARVLAETQGKFEAQQQIYQQLHRLPRLGDYYTQVCTFTAGGRYAGSCARVDESPVIRMESDCIALRIVDDEDLMSRMDHG
ncbi:MAG: bifunctional glutathionylspermidine amidase/synthase [Gammaproteobacteria bacterium]|nr:bifunctional glutathionylspermidine amidase/synthase [Gammaproteobacteria bacterium]MDH4254734.1 bifunctional glutathionylspermidine amidase/synthase [Gammaproteobacteria bacterium]MDH5308688.1 bifunctional glutathionylspermidine amidase/synthase [Gammaproteobacteria bacterium]